MAIQLPVKSKLDRLKGNVDAQELKLEDAVRSLKTEKSKIGTTEDKISAQDRVWDMLEGIIGLMDDLLSSYKEYTKELERLARKKS